LKTAPSQVPPTILEAHPGWAAEVFYNPYWYATWKLTAPDGRVRFAKASYPGVYPSIADERERMMWAKAYLPVPEIIASGSDDGLDWFVTEALPGVDATRCKEDEAAVVRALGDGLRRFHEMAPPEACPFDFTLGPAIAHCTARVEAGTESWDDLHEDFKHLTPQTALEELVATQPSSEDLVVCHGDYCFPNMLLEEGVVTGYLDLGELGVADRWWDIAVGGWSVTWNVDPKWEPLFYEAYGVEPDPERIRFYRLMYDLAS
jgi:kanamycin kinase